MKTLFVCVGFCAALVGCGSKEGGTFSPTETGDAGCTYTDYRGVEMHCAHGTSCSSPDGCNSAYCENGSLSSTLMACTCAWDPQVFPDAGSVRATAGVSYPAPDGCTTCSCKIPAGSPIGHFEMVCDSMKCK
jgi:hypothetical protein